MRRIERYLSLAWESRAVPVVVLNKSDLCQDAESKKAEVEAAAPGVDACLVSARQLTGMDVTFRELILIPGGGMVIDTPGMRELQVWGDEAGLKQAFDDIEDLSANCRFKDCSHENEPGCAVRSAVKNGALDRKRLESYLKLKREYAYLSDRLTMKASAIEKARWKPISRLARKLKKDAL